MNANQPTMTNGDIVKGGAGAATALFGVIVSNVDKIEIGLRIAGLVVGLAVGLLTLYGLCKKTFSKKHRTHHEK